MMISFTLLFAYLIAALAVALVLYATWTGVTRNFLKVFQGFLYKYIWYRLVIRRRYWAGVTYGQGLLLSVYITLNGFCMGLGVRDINDLISRTGTLASINLIPLFLGGRTSVIANFLGLSLHSYYLAHHWIGRLVVLQGLLHTALVIALAITKGNRWSYNAINISGISAASSMALLLLLSVYFVRRLAYECFLKSHFFLAIVAIVSLFYHVLPRGHQRFIYPLSACILWSMNTILRFLQTIISNGSLKDGRLYREIEVISFKRPTDNKTTAIKLVVNLRRPFKIRAGNYFYIFFKKLGFRRRLQAHPFIVSWWNTNDHNTTLSFLIQPMQGLTKVISTKRPMFKICLDGPYGLSYNLWSFELVFLFCKGIGIAGVLPHALSLVEHRNNLNEALRRKIVTRKVNLIWILEENCQMEWVTSWFEELKKKDQERIILSVVCFSPQPDSKKTDINTLSETQLNNKTNKPDEYYINHFEKKPDIEGLIKSEAHRTPGKAIVTVCGDPDFSDLVRKAVVNTIRGAIDISFQETEYQPHKLDISNLQARNKGEIKEEQVFPSTD